MKRDSVCPKQSSKCPNRLLKLIQLQAGIAAERCECICTHSEAKTFGGWPGVKKGRKGATSFQEIRDRLIFCKRYRDRTAEDYDKDVFL